ncbi:hypothetical protein BFP70_06295 [Thioclava sp. SK-1]|uniref:DUF6880 family protein n=1 Tax=Thioclava sp. SK-1 TaxID=1889770 RepID=UPI000824A836|nr:DUF6880 family protein [Thioclava sp. SK-1]OCX65752.1 hypothetical protein BFP70_06295 [Thioclava sp. SK-1]
MSKKTLNVKNLAALGAEPLAALLIEVTKGNAAQQRRVRMELSAHQGPEEVALDLRKRFAAIRQAKGRIPRKTRKTFAKELHGHIALIADKISGPAPDEGFDLLWSLLQLADGIFDRIDDHNDILADVFAAAMQALQDLAPRAQVDQNALAEEVFDAVMGDEYGVFDGVVVALSEALGASGLEALKTRARAAADAPAPDISRLRRVPTAKTRDSAAQQDMRRRMAGHVLQTIADLQGDVDAYISRYSAEQLTFHTIAPDVAARLLAANRVQEALHIVEAAQYRQATRRSILGTPDLDAAYIACLTALGRKEDLKTFLLQDFLDNLNADSLRRYLSMLPEFDDIDAEERAKAHARTHHKAESALAFFINWPDMHAAAQFVLDRGRELDGDAYELLTPAADLLEGSFPLAAVLLRRSMVLDALNQGRVKRYGYAADHLRTNARLDAEITDYLGHVDHFDFMERLRLAHSRKTGFWARIDAD